MQLPSKSYFSGSHKEERLQPQRTSPSGPAVDTMRTATLSLSDSVPASFIAQVTSPPNSGEVCVSPQFGAGHANVFMESFLSPMNRCAVGPAASLASVGAPPQSFTQRFGNSRWTSSVPASAQSFVPSTARRSGRTKTLPRDSTPAGATAASVQSVDAATAFLGSSRRAQSHMAPWRREASTAMFNRIQGVSGRSDLTLRASAGQLPMVASVPAQNGRPIMAVATSWVGDETTPQNLSYSLGASPRTSRSATGISSTDRPLSQTGGKWSPANSRTQTSGEQRKFFIHGRGQNFCIVADHPREQTTGWLQARAIEGFQSRGVNARLVALQTGSSSHHGVREWVDVYLQELHRPLYPLPTVDHYLGMFFDSPPTASSANNLRETAASPAQLSSTGVGEGDELRNDGLPVAYSPLSETENDTRFCKTANPSTLASSRPGQTTSRATPSAFPPRSANDALSASYPSSYLVSQRSPSGSPRISRAALQHQQPHPNLNNSSQALELPVSFQPTPAPSRNLRSGSVNRYSFMPTLQQSPPITPTHNLSSQPPSSMGPEQRERTAPIGSTDASTSSSSAAVSGGQIPAARLAACQNAASPTNWSKQETSLPLRFHQDGVPPLAAQTGRRDTRAAVPLDEDAGADLPGSRGCGLTGVRLVEYHHPAHEGSVSISEFAVEKRIGIGGFSDVYKVRKRDTGKLYAMKLMDKKKIMHSAQKIRRTMTEREALAKCSSPYIVKLYWAFQTMGELSFINELCPAGDLFFHIREHGGFSEGSAQFFFCEVLLGLEHLHSRGILYRDLKAENVLIDLDGHCKLGDFGLSKQWKEAERQRAYSFCGSPEYLSPEMLLGEGHDKSLDVYHLGCLLYELLISMPPHFSVSRNKLYERILTSESPVFPASIPVSDSAKDLILRLMHKDAAQRPSLDAIKQHPWCSGVSWKAYEKRAVPSPLCFDARRGRYFDDNLVG
eukprot:GHVT01005312.1.p1 GENE.GHVT01005312.1~~GHVT01005312.1.p1  ORF type:complete len:957 (-),score=104.79 GHVT01005312.1:861-3731(-)